jgi:hypothetical protein
MAEAAGSNDANVLAHCSAGSEHVRVCWVADLVMGTE